MTHKIRCLVVDDEPIARDIIKAHIEQLPQLQFVEACKNAAEAYEALQQYEVDVIFLDIRMPVTTGISFMRSLAQPPLIVFTTAFSEHAVEGFELNSVDYLMKPVTFERFCQAVQKIQERMLFHTARVPLTDSPSYLFIKQDTRLLKINFDDIIYAKAERDFCSIYLVNGKRLLASMHLKLLEASLPAQRFLRVHRSYIVNLHKVQSIQGNVLVVEQATLEIGSSYRESLYQALKIR